MRYWQLNWKLPEKNVAGFMNPAWLLSLTWSDYDTFKSITDTETSLTWEDVSDMIKSDTDTKCQSSLSTIQPSHKKYWQDKGLWWLWLY